MEPRCRVARCEPELRSRDSASSCDCRARRSPRSAWSLRDNPPTTSTPVLVASSSAPRVALARDAQVLGLAPLPRCAVLVGARLSRDGLLAAGHEHGAVVELRDGGDASVRPWHRGGRLPVIRAGVVDLGLVQARVQVGHEHAPVVEHRRAWPGARRVWIAVVSVYPVPLKISPVRIWAGGAPITKYASVRERDRGAILARPIHRRVDWRPGDVGRDCRGAGDAGREQQGADRQGGQRRSHMRPFVTAARRASRLRRRRARGGR